MATDKLVDFDHVTDCISREAMHKANRDEWQGVYGFIDSDIFEDNENMIDRVPAADVVARDCYDRILAENDTMREQLAQIGKKPGDRMDDVRPVVRAFWVGKMEGVGICSNCKRLDHIDPLATHCRYCGADMREPNLDTTKGDDHD